MSETISNLLGLVSFLGIIGVGVLIGWFVTHIHLEDRADAVRHRESILEARMKALGVATRLNVAFWRAKEELEAEGEQHRERGDQPC